MKQSLAEIVAARRAMDRSAELARKRWYHSFELDDGRVIEGIVPLEELRRRLSKMPIPADLRGKRVLDIGAWDGWFSFEMERRGAEVVAVDCIDVPLFHEMHRLYRSKVEHRIMDLYDLSPRVIGQFDCVLFLGVLYHLRHPLLALEKVCSLSRELTIVDSFVTDDHEEMHDWARQFPRLEFYEHDELGGQFDNWFGPNISCLLALCRSAGFARVTFCGTNGKSACVACYRQWEVKSLTAPDPAPVLTSAFHSRNYGINFRADAGEYVACWFESGQALTADEVFPEVAGFAAPPVYLGKNDQRWQVDFMLPPGLMPGMHAVTIRAGNSHRSNPLRIAVDFSAPKADRLEIAGVYDGFTYKPNCVELREVSYLSCWVKGLPANADRNSVMAFIDGTRLDVDFVSAEEAGSRQVNARLPAAVAPGIRSLTVGVGETLSAPVSVHIALGGQGS